MIADLSLFFSILLHHQAFWIPAYAGMTGVLGNADRGTNHWARLIVTTGLVGIPTQIVGMS
jgi:hypothetical protein